MSLNTTGAQNTALGRQALRSNTTASNNTAMGYQAGYSNTTGAGNVGLGAYAMQTTTTGQQNVSVGLSSMYYNTTGQYNVAIGTSALERNTTANYNTAVGYRAGYSKTTGDYNTFVGTDSGYAITTGSKNTIVGVYNGNQGGLDIRTSSNNIVLSDGDGNPRMRIDGSSNTTFINTFSATVANGPFVYMGASGTVNIGTTVSSAKAVMGFRNPNGEIGQIVTNGSSTSFVTSSDYRLKENVIDLTGAADRVQQLAPKRFNFIVDADKTVDGFLAHEVADIVPEAIAGEKDAVDADGNPEYQGIDQSKLVPLLTAALQEALTKIDQLETRIEALEA
jgi:hypothetical protein